MGLLDGGLQKTISGATRFVMLDATIHQWTPDTLNPDGSVTPGEFVDTEVERVGFPDESMSQYQPTTLLQADERLLLLLQKPLLDAGLELAKSDEITMREKRGVVQSLFEDPAQATFEVVVKP